MDRGLSEKGVGRCRQNSLPPQTRGKLPGRYALPQIVYFRPASHLPYPYRSPSPDVLGMGSYGSREPTVIDSPGTAPSDCRTSRGDGEEGQGRRGFRMWWWWHIPGRMDPCLLPQARLRTLRAEASRRPHDVYPPQLLAASSC